MSQKLGSKGDIKIKNERMGKYIIGSKQIMDQAFRIKITMKT
jgi:hypothetical protein